MTCRKSVERLGRREIAAGKRQKSESPAAKCSSRTHEELLTEAHVIEGLDDLMVVALYKSIFADRDLRTCSKRSVHVALHLVSARLRGHRGPRSGSRKTTNHLLQLNHSLYLSEFKNDVIKTRFESF